MSDLISLFHDTPSVGRWRSWPVNDGDRSRQALQQKRRTEHRMGREAAHAAIVALRGKEHAEAPIGRDRDGCPLWPAGIVGSIAHTNGLAVAAVASTATTAGLGIDVETIRLSNAGLSGRVMMAEDFPRLPPLMPAHVFASVFFSIKESVFKSAFPTLRIALDWADCRVRVDWVNHTFTASVSDVCSVTGRIRITDSHVASLCWLEAPCGRETGAPATRLP
jgi:4'-phosphopantetheinyl transferase EntD